MLASAKAGLNFGLMAASFMCIADAAGVLFMLTPRQWGLKLHGTDFIKQLDNQCNYYYFLPKTEAFTHEQKKYRFATPG